MPPLKDRIVAGHVSLWNAGLLLYRLVLAGFDCSEASVRSYGYNVSVILKKKAIDILGELVFDAGDIETIKPYLPEQIEYIPDLRDLSYDGRIDSINW